MLLSHQSSIREGSKYDAFITYTYNQMKNLPSVKELLVPGGAWYSSDSFDSRHAPGTYFTYSNINFGLMGTLVERLSGQRFDTYMHEHVLKPLGLKASYYLWDLSSNINNIAVLYRKAVAQTDNYQGKVPQEPDLAGYVPGTNAFKFGPQGGLRISALDLAKLQQMMYHKGKLGNVTILQPETVAIMRTTNWLYNGANGDTDHGLFGAWGIATQIITGTQGKDEIFPNTVMFGHAGDAYGLISDNFLDPI